MNKNLFNMSAVQWLGLFVVVATFIAAVSIASHRIGALEATNADHEARLRRAEEGTIRLEGAIENIDNNIAAIGGKVDFIYERAFDEE